jgi:hypothetical protein
MLNRPSISTIVTAANAMGRAMLERNDVMWGYITPPMAARYHLSENAGENLFVSATVHDFRCPARYIRRAINQGET